MTGSSTDAELRTRLDDAAAFLRDRAADQVLRAYRGFDRTDKPNPDGAVRVRLHPQGGSEAQYNVGADPHLFGDFFATVASALQVQGGRFLNDLGYQGTSNPYQRGDFLRERVAQYIDEHADEVTGVIAELLAQRLNRPGQSKAPRQRF